MTIGVASNRVTFNCDGVTTVFPVNLQAYFAADFTVILTVTATGAQTTWTLNSQYSMVSSGTLSPPYWTLTTLASSAYAAGNTLTVFVNLPLTQQTSYVQGQAFPSAAVQANFDRLTQMVQRLQDQITRCVRAPDGDLTPGTLLPNAIARALEYLAFDGSGNVVSTAALPGTSNTAQSLGLALYPQTAAEVSALVTPTNYSYPAYDIRRYGAIGDGATDNTAALNSAIAAAGVAGVPVMVPPGVFVHGRLAAINNNLSIVGSDYRTCILQASVSAWPWSGGVSTPLWSISAYSFTASGVTFDQNWNYGVHAQPAGYNDGASPATWGGYFLFSINQAPVVRFSRCGFANINRGVLVTTCTELCVENCYGNSPNGSQSIFGVQTGSTVQFLSNYFQTALWTGGVAYGLTATYCYNCVNVTIDANTFIGYQLHGTGDSSSIGNTEWVSITNNTLDTPIADTGFTYCANQIITGNKIYNSGDMGIAIDDCNNFVISNNIIVGTFSGGINFGGGTNGIVANNYVQDYSQGYTLINTLGGRYASSAGAWLSGITANFQGQDTGGTNLVVSGNVISFSTLPPVSDTYGPIRAVTNGIYFQPTTSTTTYVSGTVCDNRLPTTLASSLPGVYVNVSTHRFYQLGSTSGTPISGEKFSNGANSFLFNAQLGTNGYVYIRQLVGTIPVSTVFTGAQSGATITSATTASLVWLSTIERNNLDFTTTYTSN